MNYLFLHQNFPGQYKNIARHLAADPANRVVFVTQPNPNRLQGVIRVEYQPARPPTKDVHHYVRDLEGAVLNGQAVWRACKRLAAGGFRPDIVVGHNGWGETLFVKDVWPDVPLVGYFEFFYGVDGADVGFDPVYPVRDDDAPRLRIKNSINLLGLTACDWGHTPTEWQRRQFPALYRPRIFCIHEGIDTAVAAPRDDAVVALDDTTRLTRADEIVTYVSRSLEPYRGFHVFMRALPALLARRPHARVLIVGADDVSYGGRHPSGRSFREVMLEELGDRLDLSRVHFLGRVRYETYLAVLQISSVHVYLTFPFVLSWSMLEAMSAGCIVVGSDTAPVREVLADGQNGLLVDFHDAEALAAKVAGVLAERGDHAALGRNARKSVQERFDFNRVVRPAFTDLLAGIARGRVAAAP
ncbi:MAG: glycosyltransferase family 4 protein [Alphaproteobacteria bacterium]|jgi:glycosyltransferase involved in cell wall biosynthesis|nr:glycosyltransferase family 4 protein [Alphaproteobacteria bacterium]